MRAVIYIRVSSEQQAEKVSPQAQEEDARMLIADRGWELVEIYRDTEKYRVGRRLVEPSGTRSDRPAYKRLIADGYAGRYDVIVAWREDRLYRSYRPMLDLLDLLEKTRVDVELVKESFDRKIAPVKAWAARMELDARSDRVKMGVAGRLKKGKPWGQVPFGYQRNDEGDFVLDEYETGWVRKLFSWYAQGDSMGEIRKRFIAAGVPQKSGLNRHTWTLGLLRNMIGQEYYWTGRQTVHWGGEVYETEIPVIVDPVTAGQVVERRSQYKRYPAGNAKHRALCGGLAYCKSCGTLMRVITRKHPQVRKDGSHPLWTHYECSMRVHKTTGPDCARQCGALSLDRKVWEKVWPLFENSEVFEAAIAARVEELREQEVSEEQIRVLEQSLVDLEDERQEVIRQRRRKAISERDMDLQLDELDDQVRQGKRELAEARLRSGDQAGEMLAFAREFRDEILEGREILTRDPDSEEEAQLQRDARGKIIREVVERVWVRGDKGVDVRIRLPAPWCGASDIQQYITIAT